MADVKLRFIKEFFVFPSGWSNETTGKRIYLEEKEDAYQKWLKENIFNGNDSDDDFYRKVEAKYDECFAAVKLKL